MRLTPQCFYICLLTLLLWLDDLTTARKHHTCPIGFHLAYTQDEMPICYREKGPETFADKFKDCVGNLYTSKLYHSLNLTRTSKVLWTEYKSLYPGGPFIDWSYTASAGDILVTTYDVKYDTTLGIDEELCVIIDPVSNFTATRCYEKHYRYCFVHPYPDEHDMDSRGCAGFRGSWRFYSPSSNCLTAVTGVGGGTVRATWRQAQDLCSKRGGSLLHRGWRYSNNPLLHTSGSYPMYPMGVVMNTEHDSLRYDADNDTEQIPDSDWHFETTQSSLDAVLGAVRDQFWYLVNSSYVFFDVICENPAPLRYLDLRLTVDWEANIFLTVNDTVKKNDISCYSDSLVYYPSSTDISKTDDEQVFRVDPDHDGYYWCIQYDYKNFQVSTSNRALFIRSKQSVFNLYACKIRLRNEYRFENLDKLYKVWKKKLEVFIYYRTKFISVYGDMNTTDPYEAERVLKAFKSAKPDLNWKDSDVIFNLKIKRLYLDSKTALVHLMLNPEMQPLMPGLWDNVEVLFMKPAYFCKGFNSVPTLPLGESVTTAGSRVYSCIGDFNEGVQWVESFARGYNPPPVEITELYGIEDITVPNTIPDMAKVQQQQTNEDSQSSSEEYRPRPPTPRPRPPEEVNATTETPSDIITVTTSFEPVITVTITPLTTETESTTTDCGETTTTSPLPTTSLPPDVQLDQLLEGLEALLQNETLSLESITTTFDQVNEILDVEDEHLEIPGQLLHMLDELGARVQLQQGESTAVEVRHNVALLMADVSPTHPVRGLRVAARDNDVFDNQSFHFIASEVDTESLVANETEALVQLPASVSRGARRISFVAFRNQRAFPSSLAVNSRVFSVNVENLTTFDEGEVITIQNYTEALRILSDKYKDKLIPLESMEQFVIMIDHLTPEIISAYNSAEKENDVLTEFLSEVHRLVFLTDMFKGQTAIFTHGRAALLVVDSLEEYPVRGVKIWYKTCGFMYCCEAPETAENFQFLTEETDDSQNDKNRVALNTFEPLQGRSFILILFSSEADYCTLRWIIVRSNPQPDDELTTSEELDVDYEEADGDMQGVPIDEHVQQILDDLELLLQNETVPFSDEKIQHAFNQVDNLLEDDNNVEIPGSLLHILDELGARVTLTKGRSGVTVRDNVALLVADNEPNHPIRGVRLKATVGAYNSGFQNETFQFVTRENPSLSSNETDAVVFLPSSVTASSRRISFVVFRNGRAFHQANYAFVNSHVISINIENFTSLAPGETVDVHLTPFTTNLRRNETRTCAYWHFDENGTGFWSTDGCEFIKAFNDDQLDLCRCDHVTHFAQVVIERIVFSEFHENLLEVISVTGNSFSLFGITIIAITAVIFKSWRRNESNKIWLNLCAAVFMLDICFIITVFARFDQNNIRCLAVGIALHYSVLSMFCWMLVVSILSYRKLVLIFTREIRKQLWIVSAFAWGSPCLVIGILLAVDHKAYTKEFEEKTPSGHFCYPSGLSLWLTVYGPISIIWFVNWTLYLIIVYSMYKNAPRIRRHSGTNDSLQNASVSCLLAFLCGVPWVFGFFAFNIVAAYLFTLTTSFQGFVLFLFFVVGTKNTRILWVNLFRSRFLKTSSVGFVNANDKRTSPVSNSKFYVPTPSRSTEEASRELLSESRL